VELNEHHPATKGTTGVSPAFSKLRALRVGVVTLVATALMVTLIPGTAQAAPSLDQVRTQVRDLQAKAESATERYNEARVSLNEITNNLRVLNDRRARQKKALADVVGQVNALARATYASGGVDTSLQVLLADNPTQFLAQASALDQVAQSQGASLRRTQTARLRLAQTEAAVAQKQAAAQKVRNQMASNKRDADASLAAAEKVLDGLESAQRRRLDAQAAAARRESQASAKRELSKYSRQSSAASGRAALAVRYALQQVGDRYIAAQSGPSSFDCSGLTLAAWRQGGVSLPHYSYSQYARSKKIPLSQIRPGDLLFYFGGSVHHVSMYIGGGKMVHAANPRDGVVITPINDAWYRRYFTGVGRVL
jgi:cell wall-associated NlpC family hydrolase